MRHYTLADHLRYRFDTIMARGTSAQMALLVLITVIIVVVGAMLVAATRIGPPGVPFGPTLWRSLLHVLDNGNISNDTGTKPYLVIMTLVTLAGLTVLAALFGVVTTGIDSQMQRLRRGRSMVVERGHTLILGWSPQIFQIVSELVIANQNRRSPCIVILAERDKLEMEEEIRARAGATGRTRLVCRTGDPLDLTDLDIANPHEARSIIILSPATGDPDTHVVKTILAITHHPKRRPEKYHIVAQIRDPHNVEVARMVGKDEAQLVLGQDLISRITVQTCRQSGLSVVYTELLDFGGDEIYFQQEPDLAGATFGDALLAYEDSAVIGLHWQDGAIALNPPMDTVIEQGVGVIAVSEDDDTVRVSRRTDFGIDEAAICLSTPPEPMAEHTLILNWNERTPGILTELDNYVAPGSVARLVHTDPARTADVDALRSGFTRLQVEVARGDPTDRRLLDSLGVGEYDHVIVLGESDSRDPQAADARTLTTLLHLRDIQERTGAHFSVVSEMTDLRNRQLAAVTRADDFIVSDQLVSLMLSQLSENRFLQPVFEDLFDPDGSELYLKPAEHYVVTGRPINFYTVVEAARQRGEAAIGYRIHRDADDAARRYGITVNPRKSEVITFAGGDRIIVLAEN